MLIIHGANTKMDPETGATNPYGNTTVGNNNGDPTRSPTSTTKIMNRFAFSATGTFLPFEDWDGIMPCLR